MFLSCNRSQGGDREVLAPETVALFVKQLLRLIANPPPLLPKNSIRFFFHRDTPPHPLEWWGWLVNWSRGKKRSLEANKATPCQSSQSPHERSNEIYIMVRGPPILSIRHGLSSSFHSCLSSPCLPRSFQRSRVSLSVTFIGNLIPVVS